MPVDPDGTPHWATCPHSKEFRTRQREKERLDSRLREIREEEEKRRVAAREAGKGEASH